MICHFTCFKLYLYYDVCAQTRAACPAQAADHVEGRGSRKVNGALPDAASCHCGKAGCCSCRSKCRFRAPSFGTIGYTGTLLCGASRPRGHKSKYKKRHGGKRTAADVSDQMEPTQLLYIQVPLISTSTRFPREVAYTIK